MVPSVSEADGLMLGVAPTLNVADAELDPVEDKDADPVLPLSRELADVPSTRLFIMSAATVANGVNSSEALAGALLLALGG